MTQEDKKLLLKDLCARLPYNVMVRVEVNDVFIKPTDEVATTGTINMFEYPQKFRITPYLRPMSSMTEEESKEFGLLQTDFYVDGFLYPIAAVNMINWLNAHHIDYRGLIPMGLALEAPEGMYK